MISLSGEITKGSAMEKAEVLRQGNPELSPAAMAGEIFKNWRREIPCVGVMSLVMLQIVWNHPNERQARQTLIAGSLSIAGLQFSYKLVIFGKGFRQYVLPV